MKQDKHFYKNVFFDISNCYFVSALRIKKAVDYFGSNRILLGSDTPYGVDALGKTIRKINELDISIQAKSNILGENMRSIINVK